MLFALTKANDAFVDAFDVSEMQLEPSSKHQHESKIENNYIKLHSKPLEHLFDVYQCEGVNR